MSTPHAHHSTSTPLPLPLPGASLLTYLRSNLPPSDTKLDAEHETLLPQLRIRLPSDEETGLGFQGKRTTGYKDKNPPWRFQDILALACYLGMMFILVVNLDMFLGRWGMGIADWSAYGVNLMDGRVVGTEVHFCRAETRGGIVRSRVWRFMPLESKDECGTDVMTLTIDRIDEWKIVPGDDILVGCSEDSGESDEKSRKFLSGGLGEGVDEEELGDDLAEEGKLRMPQGNSMHAGFGGPWRRT